MPPKKGKLLVMPKRKRPELEVEDLTIGVRMGRRVTKIEARVFTEEITEDVKDGELIEMPPNRRK